MNVLDSNDLAFSLSFKSIRFSMNSLSYHFDIDENLFTSKANMKGIPYTTLYTTNFFSVIS
ncbi:hypothetical protein H8356DRAFT_1686556 [Neocallimastix lanati (nom. inval.)]|nr:hypothetical protein H8356DRAFT_1686556 [Neocallimastix sp. JGI-2020a]